MTVLDACGKSGIIERLCREDRGGMSMRTQGRIAMSVSEIRKTMEGRKTLKRIPAVQAYGVVEIEHEGDKFYGWFRDGKKSEWREIVPPYRVGSVLSVGDASLAEGIIVPGLYVRLTGIDLTRLQNLTYDDIFREGDEEHYISAWDEMYGYDGEYAWSDDPWVWNISFELINEQDKKEDGKMINIMTDEMLGKMRAACFVAGEPLMDGIKNVEVLTSESVRLKKKGEPYETKVTVVTFKDGTKEKAVCDRRDKFNLETGITICLAKHMAGGQRNLYDAVRRGEAIYQKRQKKEVG